jgi:hypothetical protein
MCVNKRLPTRTGTIPGSFVDGAPYMSGAMTLLQSYGECVQQIHSYILSDTALLHGIMIPTEHWATEEELGW